MLTLLSKMKTKVGGQSACCFGRHEEQGKSRKMEISFIILKTNYARYGYSFYWLICSSKVNFGSKIF